MGPIHECELKLSDEAPCDKILVFSHSIVQILNFVVDRHMCL